MRAECVEPRAMPSCIRVDDDLMLEPLRADHASALAALIAANRAQLGRWFPWVATSRSAADVAHFIAWASEQRVRGERDAYVIVVRGAIAGSIDLHDVERARGFARIGYWLGAAYQGRGVMTQAVRALARHAFDGGITRLEIVAAAANAASRAVAERAGFGFSEALPGGAPTGTGMEDGVVYALEPNVVP